MSLEKGLLWGDGRVEYQVYKEDVQVGKNIKWASGEGEGIGKVKSAYLLAKILAEFDQVFLHFP